MKPLESASTAPSEVRAEAGARGKKRITVKRMLILGLVVTTALGIGLAIGVSVKESYVRPRMSLHEYGRIDMGMSRAAVEAVLGTPGDHTTGPTRGDSMPIDTACWPLDVVEPARSVRWEGDQGTIYVAFDKSGHVVGKIYYHALYHAASVRRSFWDAWLADIQRLWHRWFN